MTSRIPRSKAVRARALQTAGFEGLFHEEISTDVTRYAWGHTMMASADRS